MDALRSALAFGWQYRCQKQKQGKRIAQKTCKFTCIERHPFPGPYSRTIELDCYQWTISAFNLSWFFEDEDITVRVETKLRKHIWSYLAHHESEFNIDTSKTLFFHCSSSESIHVRNCLYQDLSCQESSMSGTILIKIYPCQESSLSGIIFFKKTSFSGRLVK